MIIPLHVCKKNLWKVETSLYFDPLFVRFWIFNSETWRITWKTLISVFQLPRGLNWESWNESSTLDSLWGYDRIYFNQTFSSAKLSKESNSSGCLCQKIFVFLIFAFNCLHFRISPWILCEMVVFSIFFRFSDFCASLRFWLKTVPYPGTLAYH